MRRHFLTLLNLVGDQRACTHRHIGLGCQQDLQFIHLKSQLLAPNVLDLKKRSRCLLPRYFWPWHALRVAGAHTADGECDGEYTDVDGNQPVATSLLTWINRLDEIPERNCESPSQVVLWRCIEASRR